MLSRLVRRTRGARSRLARASVPAIALLATAVLACSARAGVAASQSRSDAREQWRLTFHVSGGFAGLDRELELANTGDATATDRRRQRQVVRAVSRDELQEIDTLVATAVSETVQDRSQCRDCLTYSIDLRTSQRQVTIRTSDNALADSRVAPLVRALARLLDRLLSEP